MAASEASRRCGGAGRINAASVRHFVKRRTLRKPRRQPTRGRRPWRFAEQSAGGGPSGGWRFVIKPTLLHLCERLLRSVCCRAAPRRRSRRLSPSLRYPPPRKTPPFSPARRAAFGFAECGRRRLSPPPYARLPFRQTGAPRTPRKKTPLRNYHRSAGELVLYSVHSVNKPFQPRERYRISAAALGVSFSDIVSDSAQSRRSKLVFTLR